MVLLSGAKPEGFQIRLCVNLECRHLPGHFWGHALSAHVCDSITLEFIWFCNSSIEKQKATAHLKGILDVSLWLHPRSISDNRRLSLLKGSISQQSTLPQPTQVTNWPLIDFHSTTRSWLIAFPKFPWKQNTQNAQLQLWQLAFLFGCYLAKGSKAFWRSHFSTGPCGITLCPWEKSVITYTVKTLLEVCQKRSNQMESCHLYTNNLQLELGIS